MSETTDAPAPEPVAAAADAGQEVTAWSDADMREALKQVVDPELQMNIVDLGLVYTLDQRGPVVHVDLTLTSPGCPYGPYILHGVKQSLLTLKDIEDVEIDVVWEPPWGPDKMTEEAKLELGFDI
jgi:metal-sulfur cluster biosynthetic enzyme